MVTLCHSLPHTSKIVHDIWRAAVAIDGDRQLFDCLVVLLHFEVDGALVAVRGREGAATTSETQTKQR